MAEFQVVSKYLDKDIELPKIQSSHSAGYDLAAAEYTEIPSILEVWDQIKRSEFGVSLETVKMLGSEPRVSFQNVKSFMSENDFGPTLVPTGLKVHLDDNEYLEITAKSSTPLKSLLIVANAPGIIDSDYYNNPGNEGHIFVQLLNFFPYTIYLEKGDRFAQGIVRKFESKEEDTIQKERGGGHGST